MQQSDNSSPFLPHGGYRNLRSYKVAAAVYDATVVFCRRFYANDWRMTDQMVQAARSGVRNISEGSGAAATSRKAEMHLTNIARSSLSDELLKDYESFLIQRELRIWPKDSREAQAMRNRLRKEQAHDIPASTHVKVRLAGLADLSDFVSRAEPEIAGNAMICAVNQAVYLLNRQLNSQGQTFMKEGGFTERLYSTRAKRRTNTSKECNVLCPLCGKEMVQRTARRGSNASKDFWGCTAYPECRGSRSIADHTPPNISDASDTSDTSNRPNG